MENNFLTKMIHYCNQVFFYLYFFIIGNYLLVNNKLFDIYYFLDLKNLPNRIKSKLLLYGGLEEEIKVEELVLIESKVEIKYEDKYLDDISKMSEDLSFTWGEIKTRDEKYVELLSALKIGLINEKHKLNEEIVELGLKFISIDDESNEDENSDEFCDIDLNNKMIQKRKNKIEEEIKQLRSMLVKLEERTEEELCLIAKKEAKEYIIKEHLDNLKNNFIIEKTPLGNVLMYYNNSREAFEYYSDNTIPYRFLETVGRKYVKTFKCKQIFVDMDFELKEFERKLKEEIEKVRMEKEKKENNDKEKRDDNLEIIKKDVFAKFKTYNKESGTGRVNRGVAPPKNSIPNNRTLKTDVILKANANRYTCEGRMSNFNFLKKQDRKKIDKKYAMSFADYKKIVNCA